MTVHPLALDRCDPAAGVRTLPAAIEVTAPCRIDLAGGTLDVYPLYLFEGGGLTVNAAVSILSRVRLERRADAKIVLRSTDLDAEATYPDLDHVSLEGPLELVARAVKFYAPPCGLTVTVCSEAPNGSGLGASSALLMALSAGLTRLRPEPWSYTDLIDTGANLEAQTIGIPTGKQDYYPALYGGIATLRFGVRGHTREVLGADDGLAAHLEERLLLSFTGISHFSGASNWHMLRNYVDGNVLTRDALRRIGATAERLHRCLSDGGWHALPELLAEEWANRRGLAEGVTTPRVEALMEAAAGAGAVASKLCGAGGGGCMVTYAPPEYRAAVAGALRDAGADVLPFAIVADGVQLREEPEE